MRAWNVVTEAEELYTAPHTFLTLGGTSALYKRTTNPHTTVGDGLALAYNAGCEIADMEFIQFHPTALFHPGDRPSFLITEAMRGGKVAYLVNTRDPSSAEHVNAGFEMRRLAIENSVTTFTSLDTVSALLDVLEAISSRISTIDAQ